MWGYEASIVSHCGNGLNIISTIYPLSVRSSLSESFEYKNLFIDFDITVGS